MEDGEGWVIREWAEVPYVPAPQISRVFPPSSSKLGYQVGSHFSISQEPYRVDDR